MELAVCLRAFGGQLGAGEADGGAGVLEVLRGGERREDHESRDGKSKGLERGEHLVECLDGADDVFPCDSEDTPSRIYVISKEAGLSENGSAVNAHALNSMVVNSMA